MFKVGYFRSCKGIRSPKPCQTQLFFIMRIGFAQQLTINITPISEVIVPKEKRDHMANLLAALQHLYGNEKWSKQVEAIIHKTVNTGKNTQVAQV